MFNDFFNLIILWFPWLSFLNVSFFIQFCILYTFFLMLTSNNIYYVLFYVFIEIFFFGLFLSFFNLEVFSAFLWLTEVVIILVSIFVLFSSYPSGLVKTKNTFNFFYKNLSLIILAFVLNYTYTNFYLSENFFNNITLSSFLWDDYYEALNNENTNDLYGLFLSFYWFNSIEYIIIGLVLLFGSLACVQLNRFFKNNKTVAYSDFFTIFDFFKDLSKAIFLRKQNLTDQLNSTSSTRIFKKKNKK